MVLLAIGSGRRRVGREFLRDEVGRDRQRTATYGGPVLAMESFTTSIGCGRRRVEGREVSVAIDGAYMARRKIWIARETGRRAIGLLPSRQRLSNYAKFALLFAKLPKIQTPNAKLLDTSFYDF